VTSVSALLAWRPDELDAAASQFALGKEQMERVGEHVEEGLVVGTTDPMADPEFVPPVGRIE
jgi:hypothetical protein